MVHSRIVGFFFPGPNIVFHELKTICQILTKCIITISRHNCTVDHTKNYNQLTLLEITNLHSNQFIYFKLLFHSYLNITRMIA